MGIEIEKSSFFYYAIERQNSVEVAVVDRIVKRNGQVVPYDGAKIILAIEKSFLSVNESVDQTYLSDLLVQIEAQFDGRQEVDVEEIQDTVEKILMKNEKYNVAKSYILYREKRTQMRNERLELVKLIGMKSWKMFWLISRRLIQTMT